jgi:hypothetical protein
MRYANNILNTPDIAFIAYFTTLSTSCSIIQQIHTISSWRTIVKDMFEHIRANPFSPDMKISGGSVGMDRTLYYIRKSYIALSMFLKTHSTGEELYCYHAEALFFMFW